MIIDPSLAKGLRRSFWQYARDDAKKASSALIEIHKRHKGNRPFSQKSFCRFVDEISRNAPASALILTKLEGRRQFIACMYLDDIPDCPLNDWDEHILGGHKIVFGRDQKVDSLEGRARIGEHAVQRLFQRGGARSELNGEFDFGAYAVDIKNAIAWAELLWFVPHVLKVHAKTILSLFAPTPSGAFLGEPSSVGHWVDFRTFIPLDQMFAAQRELWAELRTIEADVGLHNIGLHSNAHISVHSTRARTLMRIFEAMDRFPQVIGRTPGLS